MKTVSILGCGWLGIALGKKLSERFYVKGSTTQIENFNTLEKSGITPFCLNVLPHEIKRNSASFFKETDVLFICLPPGKQEITDYPKKIKTIIKTSKAFNIPKLIFTSSTRVFLDTDLIPTYTENDVPNATGNRAKHIIAAENLILNEKGFVVRFGGLLGTDRHPVHFLSGKTQVTKPNVPVNLIQQQDCVRLLTQLLSYTGKQQVFHGVANNHPTRKDFYTQAALQKKLNLPQFMKTETTAQGKIINASLTEKILDLSFINLMP